MSRPPVFPAEQKVRIVLSILAGEVTVAEAVRRSKVSKTSVGKRKQQFLEAGMDLTPRNWSAARPTALTSAKKEPCWFWFSLLRPSWLGQGK
jgi:transposase-like protein